jgi:hypothetical protein
MSKRQDLWKKQGYSQETINNHLEWEREKTRKAREVNKANQDINKKVISTIKKELLNKEFHGFKIVKINPTNDGQGFWFHCLKGEKKVRDYCSFYDYTNHKDLFTNHLKHLI